MYVLWHYCREDVVLRLGTDQVRILLFRECEWRGRKLLFDSMMVQKYQSTNKTIWTTVNDNREENCKALFDIRTARDFEVIIKNGISVE